ncbi:hypothetical protein E6P09_03505 [Haloferax mediterranei ATCC 33500]|uniref:Uncharacterized protein n=1 Tax=Haloferax mediterranei (strain ATCC 33500 / DSM 1411 / JCM 8866 / NBRC 14739 / NCIMB 2177 / R-4) TaxID=523841 RepID=I3R0R4_HALMT|nr:hypothetical protein [Haloferax mediterranei]AFK17824.1 hypothetical protein HFX_0082 [Haloferax mediterranei ATCC 33500]AHZ22750.1 hypothetical protein BM92_08880 [Haloferax mediterranei ATCC 33500]EMA02904.1 hypothetical protein C439_09985 [Haloferax mediterranei ATCC 33500]MDX5987912.1 hypothetical protein [Haloferax mediterranei ATCC 33500]QCQ74385.1 hypothetical protein E6P09_03505 [Haloferax mediterranei ATCC 33500]
MASARTNRFEYDYPVGYEPEVQTETVELDRRTVERLDALCEDEESYDELINELVSTFTASELLAARVDSPLIE